VCNVTSTTNNINNVTTSTTTTSTSTTTTSTTTNQNNIATSIAAATLISSNFHEFKISSLNIHGIKANHQMVNLLAQMNDIVCIQELIDTNEENCKSLIKVSSRDVHVKPSRHTDGRPAGGIMFVVKSIINVYLVYNAGSVENSMEYQLQLTQLLELIKKLKRKEREIFVLGDFNVDLYLSKCTNDVVSKKRRRNDFNLFLKKSNMCPSDVLNLQQIGYTYWQRRENVLYVSHIDHILVERNCKLQLQSNIQISRINSSDHNPVHLCIDAPEVEVKMNANSKFIKSNKKNWLNVNYATSYRDESRKLLRLIIDSLRDYKHCTNNGTKKVLNDTLKQISSALLTSSEIANDKVNHKLKYKKRNAWWDDEIIQHHIIRCIKQHEWAETEFKDDKVHEELKECRKKFNKVKKYKAKCKRNAGFRELDILFRTSKNEFWSRLRKMQRDNKKVNVDIDKLKNKFEKLFNESIVKNEEQRKKAEDELKKFKEKNKDVMGDKVFSLDMINKILSNLPNNKKPGVDGISNEHMKYANGEELRILIKFIMETTINTGVMPDNFNVAIIKPLIKDKTKPDDDENNTRPISISMVITNIYEKIILRSVDGQKEDVDEQFGFRSNSSCNHAITILLDAVRYNRRKGLRVYLAAIDATKAFDKVNRRILWCKMINKIDKIILRSIMNYYSFSKSMVENGNDKSNMFRTTVGVKQGGSLSPRLFALYIEDLVKRIKESKHGVYYGNKNYKVDILLYADDILLVSTTKGGLQELLYITEKYGLDCEIVFNIEKTYTMVFNEKVVRSKRNMRIDEWKSDLKLSNETIQIVTSITYLGVEISNDLRNDLHLNKRRNKSLAAIHLLRAHGLNSRLMHPYLKAQLFKTYIRPILYYGLENISLNIGETKKLQRTESTLFKMMLGISKFCHSTELLLAFGIESFQNKFRMIKYAYFSRLMTNKCTRKFLNEQLEVLKNQNYPEKEICTINQYLNLLKECADTNEILNLDYVELELNDIRKKCTERKYVLSNIKSALIKYNKKIEQIKLILSNNNSQQCLHELQQHTLPDKMKEYFSSLDQNTTEKEDKNQPSIHCDFMEVDVG